MNLLEKLQGKGKSRLLLWGAPEEFAPLQKDLEESLPVLPWKAGATSDFLLVFCINQAALEKALSEVGDILQEDTLLWMAYPKKSSKAYKSDLNRDAGWGPLGQRGYEPVRQIALDEDWSALRFKPAGSITRLSRSAEMLLSEEGKTHRTRK